MKAKCLGHETPTSSVCSLFIWTNAGCGPPECSNRGAGWIQHSGHWKEVTESKRLEKTSEVQHH